jgi:hypothetical protein
MYRRDRCVIFAVSTTGSGLRPARISHLVGRVNDAILGDRWEEGCLNVQGGGTADGTPVRSVVCSGTGAQGTSLVISCRKRDSMTDNQAWDIIGYQPAQPTMYERFWCPETTASAIAEAAATATGLAGLLLAWRTRHASWLSQEPGLRRLAELASHDRARWAASAASGGAVG